MELRNLLTYSKVCEAMSFSKAADQLGYAQSTVTTQIAQLEEVRPQRETYSTEYKGPRAPNLFQPADFVGQRGKGQCV